MNIWDKLIDINYKKGMGITGITDEFFCLYVDKLLKCEQKDILIVVNSLYEANKLYTSILSHTSKSYLFPMDDFLTSEAIAISPDLEINRLETLNETLELTPKIVITNLMGYLRYLPTKKTYQNSIINLKVDMEIEPLELVKKLIYLGYKKETLVTKTGEIGVRGFIIDLFPVTEENPIRIEFFGDVIESIRYFDSQSQKSLKSIKQITIKPITEFLLNQEIPEERKQKNLAKYTSVVNISSYLDNPIVIYKDYSQLKIAFNQILEEINTYRKTKDSDFSENYMFDLQNLIEINYMHYLSIDNISSSIDTKLIQKYEVQTIQQFNENVEFISKYIQENLKLGKTIVLCISKSKKNTILKKINLNIYETNLENIKTGSINLVIYDLNEGFIYKDYIFITEKELFMKSDGKKSYKTKFKYGSKIKDINNLVIGDYVVHNAHGIGIYNGIKVLTTKGISKDYIEVLYSGKDKLYIPVEKIDLLYKYVGKEGVIPKINKMDGIDWKKTKQRVRQKVADMADKLLKLYAERESRKGYAFSEDSKMMEDFENECEFTLTPDQQLAVNQIKLEMEKALPMDHLLCGDVGFGKTEVAFRASMKAILDSKQVLFLCPTTILSNQHYENAIKRFENFPVNIALLNRFTTPKETKKIIEGLKNGTIDLVFGTHRLLSDDVKLNDLGLLIIDEEQRFGVMHKEKIKQYKTDVDVLTLTATPIPRTLQMSMVGMRSLSLIETPPVDRYPIQTYVVEENKQLIKDAIYKELSRKGQIFILYNSVEKIESKLIEIQNLVPDAKITYAHGQMTKTELENRMYSFIGHEYDVLLCTTIIETGIDIPNVNTLIILNADRFGLSQLYQIRGRVGRSNKFAYAYFMYKPSKVLTEAAVKRLNVIKEFTELGSGFSIATRDLSIRGAGDILGSEQAGFIDTVGIDLYLKMLDSEVAKRKGIDIFEEEENSTPLINVTTHIKDSYVNDENLKIEIHRKINEIDTKNKLYDIKSEIEDRFGKIDNDILIYMYEEWFEKQANQIGIKSVVETKNYIELCFPEDVVKKLNTEDLFVESFKISPMFRFKSRGSNLLIILDTIRLDQHPLFYLTDLLDIILNNNLKKSID